MSAFLNRVSNIYSVKHIPKRKEQCVKTFPSGENLSTSASAELGQTHPEGKFLLTTLRPAASGWSVKTSLQGGSGLTLLQLRFINSLLQERFLHTALSFWDMFIPNDPGVLLKITPK